MKLFFAVFLLSNAIISPSVYAKDKKDPTFLFNIDLPGSKISFLCMAEEIKNGSDAPIKYLLAESSYEGTTSAWVNLNGKLEKMMVIEREGANLIYASSKLKVTMTFEPDNEQNGKLTATYGNKKNVFKFHRSCDAEP